MRKVTGTVKAYVSDSTLKYFGMPDLDKSTVKQLMESRLSLFSGSAPAEWIEVGTADITLTLISNKDTTSGRIEALRAMKKEIMAKAQAQAMHIDGQINDLLALSYDGEQS